MARVGTWRYELATGTLHRSEPLQEIYGERGVEPDGSGGPVEGEQVALLVRSLRAGAGLRDHEAELVLPGARLSCRAEVEFGPDGAPARLIGVVRDVTAQHELEARARHAARRFADLAALVPTGVAIVDPDGVVREVNPALCALLDVVPEQLRGVPGRRAVRRPRVRSGRDRAGGTAAPAAARLAAPGGARRGAPLPGGGRAAAARRRTTVWCELAVSTTTLDDDGWFWLLACTDVSEQRRAAELLRSAGTVDELTRLPNREHAWSSCTTCSPGPTATGSPSSAATSTTSGASTPRWATRRATTCSSPWPAGCSASCRWGARRPGSPPTSSSWSAATPPTRAAPRPSPSTVAGLLRTTLTVRGRPVQLTASVGWPCRRTAGTSPRPTCCGSPRSRCTTPSGPAVAGSRWRPTGCVGSATRDLELEAELRAAIAANTLVLEYQPVVGPDGLVCTAEALVRWPHPEHGVIPPGEFLPIAQRGGLLRELDDWVLRTACREAAGWPEHGGRPVAVAVNLAGLLPGDPEFRATVTDIVESAGLPWDRLVLEVVETSLVALPAHALAAMDRLVQRGVRFAIDDFGTGYSSLARLKELPAQIVKVDRAFVRGVATDPADFAVARAVVDMAKAMGRSTVAEGVETTEQYHVLRGVGVDAQQGWLFARSLPPRQLREMLAGGRVAVRRVERLTPWRP